MATKSSCDVEVLPDSLGVQVFKVSASTPHVDDMDKDKKMVARVKEQLLKIDGVVPAGVNLANGKMVSDIGEAMEGYLERDYEEIFKITSIDPRIGQTGAIFVPLEWLSSNPELLDPVEAAKKFQDAKDNNLLSQAQLKKRYEELRKYKGEPPEKAVYDQMKFYAAQTGHELLLIHSPHILKPGKGEQEADFILVDRTLGAIVNIEVKASLTKTNNALQKAKIQLEKNKELLEAWFGDLLNTFLFIGLIYTESVEKGINICPSCDAFLMVGEADILKKMLNLKNLLKKAGHLPGTNAMDYRNLAKFLLFAIHANKSGAPVAGKMVREVEDMVEKAGTAENVKYWSCWTPGQLGLVGKHGPRFALFPSSMCTGKTECLVGKAMERARAGEKVLVVVFGYASSRETLLFYKLKRRLLSHPNIVVRYLNHNDLKTCIAALKGVILQFPDQHVMVDELVLPEPKYLSQMAQDVEQLRMDLEKDTGMLRILWFVLAGGKNFTPAHFSEANFKNIFKGFYLAKFSIPLRGTRHVSNSVKNQTTCNVSHFRSNINLELPTNLVRGIPPAEHYFSSYTEAEVTAAVKEAMQRVNREHGRKGVAVIVSSFGGSSDIDCVVKGVEAAGRPTPLVYCDSHHTLGTVAGEAELDQWMEGRGDRQDLVVDAEVVRGWEEVVNVVVEVGFFSGSYGPENMYLRTISRLIIVKEKT